MKKEGKITDELINKLLKWRHSGFSIDNGVRIKKEDKEGREAIAQYMMRNVFNTQNISHIEKTGKVIYHTGKIQEQARDPPHSPGIPDEIVYVPFEDAAWDRQESQDFVG